jgi:glycosyltransferase involved in cell wall biosynthesis
LIPLSHPEYCRAGEADKHRLRLLTMLREGRGLIANSADTRDALERFATKQGVHVPPTVVASLAPASLAPIAQERPLIAPYFVMLGTIEPRKNHLMVLQVWRQMIEEQGETAPHLVIIGQRGWECEQIVDLLERCEALKSHVLEIGHCNDAELTSWLLHSQALLFPSFAEGYGMPIVEALMLGVPVLASQLSVFSEIASDIPDYLNPLDGIGWQRAILDYAQPHSRARDAQCRRMQDFRAPTWSQHFEVVESLLERVV